MYKELDMVGYVSEIIPNIPNKPLNIKQQIRSECEYLGSPLSIWNKAGNDYYIITEFKTYKDKTKPYITLYQANSGELIKTKVKDGQFYTLAPFFLFDLIKVVKFKTQKKTKCIGGKWQKTNEDEQILSEWIVY